MQAVSVTVEASAADASTAVVGQPSSALGDLPQPRAATTSAVTSL